MKPKVNIIIDNRIRIQRGTIPRQVVDKLRERLIFTNPKWLENERQGRWNGETPEHLKFLHQGEAFWSMPRGFMRQLLYILDGAGVPFEIDDRTRELCEVSFDFAGDLYPFQVEPTRKILARCFGVLNAPTGSGKTVMALKVIAERKRPALVVVHSKELLCQWRERAVEFLNLDPEEIGIIGDGHQEVGERLTIGIINSLYKCADKVRDHIGHLIIDECHRTPARTFTEAVNAFDSRFMLGLSATPYRRDGLTRLIYFHLGDQVHEIDTKELQAKKQIMTPTLTVRETDFDYDFRDDYTAMLTVLTEDCDRNELIVNDVIQQVRTEPGIALVLSDRKEHCRVLLEGIQAEGIEARMLTGEVGNGERKATVKELDQGEVKVLVATGQLIGEGFDLSGLSTLFLTTPVKFDGRVKQYIGRVLRTARGKRQATIYDYLDRPGVLQASHRSRLYAYQDIGIDVRELIGERKSRAS